MTAYTIRVLNESGADRRYFAFTETPSVVASGPAPTAAGNADNLVASAWQQPVYMEAPHPVHEVKQVLPIAPGEIFDFVTPPPPPAPVSLGGAQNGSFQILTGADFIPDNNYVVGLARSGAPQIPSPVATFVTAQPNETVNITPVEKFYVSDGAYTAGGVIDVTLTSAHYATIDFSGRSETTATIVQAVDGSFTVTYS